MSFLKTKGFKYLKNLIIGVGASVVLLGALFKIMSWPLADEMLVAGMITEAILFFFLGVIGPDKDYYWEKLYPGAGWLIGQTWSTFMDLDDLPETVDFNGPIGAPFSRRTMIRYTYADPKSRNKFTFAIEDPEDQFGGGSANERMPQLVARFDKSYDWGAVNARLLAHEKRSASQTKRGFGFGVGGSYKLTDKDLLMGQYTRVDGDVDQLYGSNGYAIDAATGDITFDKNQGLVLGYAKTFSDQLRGTVVLGLNQGKTAQAVDNRTLKQFHVGLIYSPLKNVELGGELILGERKTFNDEKGTMSRFDLMGRYSF